MLRIRFTVHLEDHGVYELVHPKGVLFHRWLPDGQADAIEVPVRHKDNKLQIWFERKGYINNEFIRYDSQKSEVDPAIMARQGKLDAGPLCGKAIFSNVMDEEFKAVQDDRVGSEEYIALGKRIVDFLYPPLSNFISILRTQYGQYWLRELERWDSRKQSLGDYCRTTLGLYWSDDDEKHWNRFMPTKLSVHLTLSALHGRGFGEYLTKDDWDRLSNSFDPDKAQSLAAIILGKAHELHDSGELKHSFIEGVTALEVVLDELVRRRRIRSGLITNALTHFLSLSVREKFSTVALISDLLSEDAFEKTLKAIHIRNDIVHEGKSPQSRDEDVLRALFQTVAVFLGYDECKFPELISGNRLYAPDE